MNGAKEELIYRENIIFVKNKLEMRLSSITRSLGGGMCVEFILDVRALGFSVACLRLVDLHDFCSSSTSRNRKCFIVQFVGSCERTVTVNCAIAAEFIAVVAGALVRKCIE